MSEKLEYIPAHFVVNQYVRPQYSCSCCQRVVSGEMPAQIMGLLETAKMNGLEPHAWLTDVLKRLPSWPEDLLDELLPFPAFRFSE